MTPSDLTTISRIVSLVCDRYGVSMEQLESHRRDWKFVWPRRVIYWLCKRIGLKQTIIGLLFNRTPSDISHALRRLEIDVNGEPALHRKLNEDLMAYIKASRT